MFTKLIYKTITITNREIDPVYLANVGEIVDKNTRQTIIRLENVEMPFFFHFKLEFVTYKYTKIYQPSYNSYKKVVSARIYNLIMYLNLTRLILDNGQFTELHKILSKMFLEMKILELYRDRSYQINPKEVKQFIERRENYPMTLIPWFCMSIDQNYLYHLKQRKVFSTKQINILRSKKNGGIIETNNVPKLVRKYFSIRSDPKMTLVILPKEMNHLWPNTNRLNYTDITEEHITIHAKKKFHYVIIHECHFEYLPSLKKLLNSLVCNTLWVINSLPLQYYAKFDSSNICLEKNPKKLNLQNLASISNLWFNFTNDHKKKYKTRIIYNLITQFTSYYTSVSYPMNFNTNIIRLSYMGVEKNIKQLFDKYYDNWKNKLTGDPNNIYSITIKQKNNKIESDIFSAIFNLIMSVVKNDRIPFIFKTYCCNYLLKFHLAQNKIENILELYQKTNQLSNYKITEKQGVDFERHIIHLKQLYEKIDVVIKNYQRYVRENVYQMYDDTMCSICYSDEKLVRCKLICGHGICLECILHSLSNVNKCPICNEYININKILIIEETVENYRSEINDYLRSLTESVLILTDIPFFQYTLDRNGSKALQINLENINIYQQLQECSQINEIVLLLTPTISEKNLDEINKIVGYLRLHQNVKLTKLEIQD